MAKDKNGFDVIDSTGYQGSAVIENETDAELSSDNPNPMNKFRDPPNAAYRSGTSSSLVKDFGDKSSGLLKD